MSDYQIRKQLAEQVAAELRTVQWIETLSINRGGDYDQSVRNLVRIITEKGPDYKDTEHGDMTHQLLKDLLHIMTEETVFD